MQVRELFKKYKAWNLDRQITRFWKYFEKSLEKIEAGDKAVLKQLQGMCHPLRAEVDLSETTKRLIFTAWGMRKHYPKADQYSSAAPALSGWKIEKLRTPQQPKSAYAFNKHEYKLSDFRFSIGPHSHNRRLDILFHTISEEPELLRRGTNSIVKVLLELLGEDIIFNHTEIRSVHDRLVPVKVEDFSADWLIEGKDLHKYVKEVLDSPILNKGYFMPMNPRKHDHACDQCGPKGKARVLNFSVLQKQKKDDTEFEFQYDCQLELHQAHEELYLFVTLPEHTTHGKFILEDRSTLAARWGQLSGKPTGQFGFTLYDAADDIDDDKKSYGHLMTRKEAKQTGLDKKLWEITDYIYISPPKDLYRFLQEVYSSFSS